MRLPLRRRVMLHPLRSRHNPLTRLARYIVPPVIVLAVLFALYDGNEAKTLASSQSELIEKLSSIVSGRVQMVEDTGEFIVVSRVESRTYSKARRTDKEKEK